MLCAFPSMPKWLGKLGAVWELLGSWLDMSCHRPGVQANLCSLISDSAFLALEKSILSSAVSNPERATMIY